jgi:alkylhydroperoxidase family enzyme
MARLPYLDAEALPAEYRRWTEPANPDLETSAESPWAGPRNTHRVLANNPAMLAAYREFAADLWEGTGLSERHRELAILGCGRALDSAYEWHQHVLIALDGILSQEEILAVSRREYDSLDADDVAIVEYAMAFAERSVDAAIYEALTPHFDESTILGTSLLLAYYVGIDFMGAALSLDLEEEFVGWKLENVPE